MLWGSSPASWGRDGGIARPDPGAVLDEVDVAPQAVACSFDVHDDGMVQQPVQQGGGDHGVAEHLAPFGKAAVGGEDHRTPLVAGVDELEEQVPATGDDRQVADLVDDQELGPAQEAEPLAQRALARVAK